MIGDLRNNTRVRTLRDAITSLDITAKRGDKVLSNWELAELIHVQTVLDGLSKTEVAAFRRILATAGYLEVKTEDLATCMIKVMHDTQEAMSRMAGAAQ